MKPLSLHARRLRRAAGVSLIEVLVVLVLFSIGLIGVVALQARAVQNSVSAEDFNRAAMLANEAASLMWTKQTLILPTADVTAWQTAIADPTDRGLPNGTGDIAVVGQIATITITWRPPSEPSTSTPRRYVTHVQLAPS